MSIFPVLFLLSEIRSSLKRVWCLLDLRRFRCLPNTRVAVRHPPGAPVLPSLWHAMGSRSPSTSLRELSNKFACMRVCAAKAAHAVSRAFMTYAIHRQFIDYQVVSRGQGRTETFATTVSLHGAYASGRHTGVSRHDTRAPARGKPAVRTLRNTPGQQ